MNRFVYCLRFLIASTLLALGVHVAHAQGEQRIALVIGNAAYKSSPLRNPVNDARDVAVALRGYGFTVIERANLTTRQIGPTLREFRSRLSPGSVAVVFYAGHGVQIKGENYLPAVDADISGEEDVPNQSLSTRQLMDVLADARTRMNLVFLDACRDNPYARGFRSASRGLSRENAPSGTLLSFATRPGSVAADGDNRNGLYTSVLLEQIKQADQPIELVLKSVVSGVKTASKGQQEPWMEGSIEGDFCFGVCAPRVSVATVPAPLSEAAIQERFWSDTTAIDTVAAYRAYLERYPQGVWASLARAKIEKLTAAVPTLSVPPLDRVVSTPAVAADGMRFGYIDVATLMKLTGTPADKDSLAQLNPKVREFAQRFQIKLILQEATYTQPRANITQALYAYMASRPVPTDFPNTLPVLSAVKVRFINVDRVLTRSELALRATSGLESEFKSRERELANMVASAHPAYSAKKRAFDEDLKVRRNEEMAKIIAVANRAIVAYSRQQGIDLVLQEAVYIDPEYDITDKLLPQLR